MLFTDKVTIITGASSGIGRACAIEFARNGSHVVLTARDKTRLAETEKACKAFNIKTLCIIADITSEESCKNIVDQTIELFGRIDILINNAGISMRAMFNTLDLEVVRDVMNVNFWGTVYCTKYALPHILEQKGSIVGVISTAGFRGLPGRTAYSASKFAINGFLEVLRTEHLYDGLHVLVAAPGFTATNIRRTALTADGSEQGVSPRDEGRMMTPEQVAGKMIKAVKCRRRYLIMSYLGRATYILNKFFPGFMDRQVYRHMSKEPNSPFRQKKYLKR